MPPPDLPRERDEPVPQHPLGLVRRAVDHRQQSDRMQQSRDDPDAHQRAGEVRAPGAHLVSLRVLDANGQGTVADVIDAIDWAVANRDRYQLRIINLSLGTRGHPDDPMARTEFYQHDQNWSNRVILGDSLQAMASLAEREGLRGKVQCIYFDPPYGIKFNSNSSGARQAGR